MKTIKIPDETFEFLAYLARQDVTLPALFVDYLQWDQYTKEQIKTHFEILNEVFAKTRSKERK
jgi:hypothetical protein